MSVDTYSEFSPVQLCKKKKKNLFWLVAKLQKENVKISGLTQNNIFTSHKGASQIHEINLNILLIH